MKINKAKYNKIETFVLKPKKRKTGSNTRATNHTCPECLSTLLVDNFGDWKCSGDKLNLWIKDFERFNKMTNSERINYIETISNQDKFLELFDKWALSKTNKSKLFECEYSSKIHNSQGNYSVDIPDPIFINGVEKKLGRKLTEAELMGDIQIWVKNEVYSDSYTEGAEVVEIPWVKFPDEV